MVFKKYDPQVKSIVVKLLLRDVTPDQINAIIEMTISERSMRRWLNLFISTRNVVRDPRLYEPRGAPLKVSHEEREFILDVLNYEPCLYLDEIQSHIEAMTGFRHPKSTLHDELQRRLGLSLKVAQQVHPAQCPAKRAAYIGSVANLPSNYLVFVDECAVTIESQHRRNGWSRVGDRTPRVQRPTATTRWSVLPAVSLDGLVAVMAQEGSINRMDFEYFLEEMLIPCMNSFPGPNSVVIMDNARIHHGGRIEEICTAHNVLPLYLPPYSPDFNPIEKVFSVLKSRLKREQILAGTDDDGEVIKEFLPSVVTPELMRALFSGSGYP